MKTIDRYVCRNFLFSYLVVLAGFLGLAIVIDASMKLDEFLELVPANLTAPARVGRLLAVMGNWYLVQVPLFFRLLMPIITVLAAVVTVVMMKRRNEFVPLMASGVSVYRALGPVVVLALVMSFLGAANQEVLLPRLAHRLLRAPDDPRGERPAKLAQAYSDSQERGISAESYTPATRTLNRVHIQGPALDGARGDVTIAAERAVWLDTERAWRLEDGWMVRAAGTETQPVKELFGPGQRMPSLLFCTSLRPEDVDRPTAWVALASAADLMERLSARPDKQRLRVELHSRYVVPLNAIILLLLGLPLILMQESKSVIVGLGMGLLICLAYLGVQFVSQQMGTSGRIAPALAVWLPIFIFGPVAIILFDSIRT